MSLRCLVLTAALALAYPRASMAFVSGPALAPRVAPSMLSMASVKGSSLSLRAAPKLAAAQLKRKVDSGRSLATSSNLQMNIITEGLLRVASCLPYILPMMDSLAYGRFIFQKVPLMQLLFVTPLQPFIDLAQAFPMLSFVAFLGLFLFVVRNKKVPRFVRFNTMQSLLLEIILIFPQILTSGNMGGAIPFMFTEFISNMTFYSVVSIVAYSCISNLRGELPCKIPVVSTAVFQQIGGGAGFED